MKKITLIFIVLIISSFSICSHAKIFIVKDKKTNKRLPFATVIFDKHSNSGTIANIEGEFYLDINKIKSPTISITYIGYQKRIVDINFLKHNSILKLKPLIVKVGEVVKYAQRNPANIIIDKVRQNMDLNNPYNLDYFECNEYSKHNLDQSFEEQIFGRDENKKLESDGAIFTETIYKRYYQNPEQRKIIVKANRASGFKKSNFHFLIEELQPFHFYDNPIKILYKNYLNPLSDGNFSNYFFILRDSIKIDNHTVYNIEFHPRDTLSYNELKGAFQINSNRYAIQSVVAEPARKEGFRITIEQKYEFIDNKAWFPVLHNSLIYDFAESETSSPSIEIELEDETNTNDTIKSSRSQIAVGRNLSPDSLFVEKTQDTSSIDTIQGVEFVSKSFLRNIVFEKIYETITFDAQLVEIDKDIVREDSTYWKKNREIPLTQKDIDAYERLDSIIEEIDFSLDDLFIFKEYAYLGKLYYKQFNYNILQLYNHNKIEGHRFGFGAETNHRVSSRFSVGGHIAYGTTDGEFKYGMTFQLNLNKASNMKMYFSYFDDYKLSSSEHLLRSYFIYDYNKYEEFKCRLSFVWDYFDVDLSVAKQDITGFINLHGQSKIARVMESEIILSYDINKLSVPSWRSDYESENFTNKSIERFFPKIKIKYQEGFDNILNGEYSYSRLKISTQNMFVLSELGEFNISTEFGLIEREISYSKLFSGNSIFAKETFFYFDNVFQTIEPNEFVSSRFINVFLFHKFRPIAFKTTMSRPVITIALNIGFSDLENGIKEQNPNLKYMAKGLYETGIAISNIIKFPIQLFKFGAGFSCFYRWGEYSNTKDKEKNLNVKFVFSFGF